MVKQAETKQGGCQVIRPLLSPYDVMDSVLLRGDAVKLGDRLNLSPQLIRHWCRPPETSEEYVNTGRKGPLQRVGEIIDYVVLEDGSPDRAYPIGRHIARRLGGVFVPVESPATTDSNAAKHISDILKEVGEAVEWVRKSWFEDAPGRFTASQRAKLAC